MKRNKYETPEIVVNRFDVNTRTMVDIIDGDVVTKSEQDLSIPEVTTLPNLPHSGGGM